MSSTDSHARTSDSRMLDRMLFFSDAVFAIVLTLLVLELRAPTGHSEAELAEGLGELTVNLIAFAISFALGGIFWLAHMRTMRALQTFDWPTAGANLIHLLAVALTPFASALLGEHIDSPLAFEAYSVMMVAVAFTSGFLWLVASRGGGRLMGGVSTRNRIAVALRASGIGWCFLAAVVLANLGQITLARFCWVFIIPINVIAGMIGDRKAKPAPVETPAEKTPDAVA